MSFESWIYFLLHFLIFGIFPFILSIRHISNQHLILYSYFGLLICLATILPNVYSIQIFNSFVIDGGAFAYVASIMTLMIILIVTQDISLIKNFIFMEILLNMMLFLYLIFIRSILSDPLILNPPNFLEDFFSISLKFVLIGTFTSILELTLLIIIIEKIKGKIHNNFLRALAFCLIFISIISLDGLLFPLLAFIKEPFLGSAIVNDFFVKLTLGTGFGLILFLYLITKRSSVEIFSEISYSLRKMFFYNKTQILEELKQEKEALERLGIRNQKLESLGLLAGGIAHDFNNYLTSILGNISIIKEDCEKEQEIYEYLTEIEKVAKLSSDLSFKLLTFAKGGEPVKKYANITELIKESANFTLRGTPLIANYNIVENLWPVFVDLGQINQVIQNIVLNASQASNSNNIVTISAENCTIHKSNLLMLNEGNYVKISIEDKGVGIPEENLSKIFDPYFTTKEKGTGLGLAVCYSIIKKHGGTITVDSELKKGTSFTFYLKARAESVIEKPASKQKRIKKRKNPIKILLLEDQEEIIQLLINMGKKLNFQVNPFQNSQGIIHEYKKSIESGNPYDLVILDLIIPGDKGGKEVSNELLQINPKEVMIASSGSMVNEILQNFSEYGFKNILIKPYSIYDLAQCLDELGFS